MEYTYMSTLPFMKIWFSAYTDNKSEYFEIRTCDASGERNFKTLWHKSFPLGMSVADFLYEDDNLEYLKTELQILESYIFTLNSGQKADEIFPDLFARAKRWADTNPLYLPLAIAIEQLRIEYEQKRQVSIDNIQTDIVELIEWKHTLSDIIHNVFETDKNGDPQENFIHMAGGKQWLPQFPQYGMMRTESVVFDGHIPYPYDYSELMDFGDLVLPKSGVATVLNATSLSDLVGFLIAQYLCANLRFRTCKCCGKLFGIMTDYRLEYCSREIDGLGKTCREMGATRVYGKKVAEEPAIKEYTRSYKAHNARIRYGIMTRDEFNIWAAEAREKRDACVAGKLSFEEFVAWLDSDKHR